MEKFRSLMGLLKPELPIAAMLLNRIDLRNIPAHPSAEERS